MTAVSTGTTLTPVKCPDCGEQSPGVVGRLPNADYFAGRVLKPAMDGGSMYACEKCHLHYRWPRLAKEQMDDLYAHGEAENWSSSSSKRSDWRLAADWIEPLELAESVLDIACFDGRFLSLLPSRHDKYGVEIQPVAAQRAAALGVNIISDNFEKLSQHGQQFSIITAFDILEHTHQPLQFLKQLSQQLQPGGVLIIGTGNTDATSWRLMGTDYWYCSTIEHISFINPQWCQLAASGLGLEVTRLASLSHSPASVSKICRETAMNLSYRVAPNFTQTTLRRYRHLVRSKKRTSDCFRPSWYSAKDHLLVMFRKPLAVACANAA